MEYYMDEKRKLSTRDDQNNYSNSSSKSHLTKSMSLKSSTFTTKSPLSSSSSQKSSPTKSSLPRSSSLKCAEFARKCNSKAKEQRAKFYIVKQCISMLLRRNKHGDS